MGSSFVSYVCEDVYKEKTKILYFLAVKMLDQVFIVGEICRER